MVYDLGLKDINSYVMKTIKIKLKNSDLIDLATYLATENGIYEDFIVYENNFNISIGIGVLAKIDVLKNSLVCKFIEAKELEIQDINEDLSKVLGSISDKEWRAYGLIDFDYSKYIYLDKNVCDNKKLIEIILPQIDVSISKNEITIKAQKENDLVNIEKLIKNFEKHSEDYFTSEVDLKNILNYNSSEYKDIVRKAVSDMKSGKYQKVILSRKIPLDKRVKMKVSYLFGRKNNSPARSYYLKLGDNEVIGFSPETIVEVDKDRNVYTFPLAGTRAIGGNTEETERLKKELLTDTKEIAEHAVSVKLAFEELQNCCETDSVNVIRFMDIIERGTVQHLASRLKGKLKENMNEWHALYSLFSAVTATGIPKKESIEAISTMELDDRGLYSGGVFTCDHLGCLDVALVLRSAYQNKEESWVRAGAGIVSSSNPERELEETKEKLSSVLNQIVYQ